MASLLLAWLTTEARDWAFVQQVGGIEVGKPYRTAEGVMLPVRVDVSGLTTITVKPTLMNSGLVLRRVDVQREGEVIALTVMTCVAGEGHSAAAKGDVALGALPPGRYAVVYAEPGGGRVDLGAVTVP